jgi:uncharacterized protein (DUF1501 family)
MDRRDFLKKSGCALSMAALATQMPHFGLMSVAAQKNMSRLATNSAMSDYRALVCIFLSGGNDSNNMIVPRHNSSSVSNYSAYSAARGSQQLAVLQSDLLPISVPRMGGLEYGLHPMLGPGATGAINNGIHELWAQNRLAAVTNVGTLVAPLTRTQFLNNTVKRPYQLYSHPDQITQAQGGRSDTQPYTGWAGRISDLMTAQANPNGLIPMITSISGAQLFTAGQTTLPLAIANAGTALSAVLNPTGFNTTASSVARRNAFNALRGLDLDSEVIRAASYVTDQAMRANDALQVSQEVSVAFPATGIGNQLKQVARLIKKRGDLGVARQIFYVQLGGFDTHSGQVNGHINLLSQLSQAMRAFYDEMIVQGMSDKVTQFTMSDFNRTFNPAGSGSGTVGTDHAWGGHCLVLGGAVTTADFYGNNTANGTPFPTLAFGTADDADNGSTARGRWIPTTSNEQYAANLARWFGVSESDMASVFPRINNFGAGSLGFLQGA